MTATMTTIVTSAELHGAGSSLSQRPLNPAPTSAPIQKQPLKPAVTTAPRIDVEPIYTALKSLIGEHWQIYKTSVAEFVLGKRNQAELKWIIGPFLHGDPKKEHLHNQLILAIFANTQRDVPETGGVASWVSANDKPTTTLKPVTGDAAEQQLKTEIMQLTAKERGRLKNLQEEPVENFGQDVIDEYNGLEITLPDTQSAVAGGYNRTNWEPEVQKRYAQPLFCESNEFPDVDALHARMVPTCYEEGIFNGPARDAPAFMSQATEAFLKNLLSRALQVCRSDGAQYVQTRAYKRRRRREEAAFERGEVRKSTAGLLPVDQEALERRQPLSLLDLRLCVDVGTHGLGRSGARAMMRFEATGIDDETMFGERGEGEDALPARRDSSAAVKAVVAVVPPKPLTNGVLTNGVHHHDDEYEEVDDDDDCGWPGGSANDRRELENILADCLEI